MGDDATEVFANPVDKDHQGGRDDPVDEIRGQRVLVDVEELKATVEHAWEILPGYMRTNSRTRTKRRFNVTMIAT